MSDTAARNKNADTLEGFLMMKAFVCAIALLFSGPCSAATLFMDISARDGFDQLGAAGILGNGYLYVSPVYHFAGGTTVDFGTATVLGDGYDGRQGPCSYSSSCLAQLGTFQPFFLTGNTGGVPTTQINLPASLCATTTGFCDPVVFALLLTMPQGSDGVQLAFQGTSLIIEASQVPIPTSAALFITGAGALRLLGWRRRIGRAP